MTRVRLASHFVVAAVVVGCGSGVGAPVKPGPATSTVALPRPSAEVPRADAYPLVLVDHLPADFPPSEAKRLQALVGDKLSAPKMGLDKFGVRLITAAARDRILETLASGKLAADGPTCRYPASAANVMQKADAPADLAVAHVYVTKTSLGQEQLLAEVRAGYMFNARSFVLSSEIDAGRDIARAVAKLDYDPNARTPFEAAPTQKDPYLDELCTHGRVPSVDLRLIADIDHAPLPIVKLHQCSTKGHPEKLTAMNEETADVSMDLAADGRIERLRVSGVDAPIAACLESVLREVPFSCPFVAGTTAGTLKIGTSSINVPGCGAGASQLR